MVRVTSARPSAGRPAVPAKTTSSILPPRSGLTPCSPITQENASTTLDLPDPLGPTTQVMPGSKRIEVAEAKDLKPRSVRVFRYTRRLLPAVAGRTHALPHLTVACRPGSSLRIRVSVPRECMRAPGPDPAPRHPGRRRRRRGRGGRGRRVRAGGVGDAAGEVQARPA